MAATVVLNVDVNDAQALAKLNKLDADVKALEGKKHVITLEIKGAAQIQNVTKEMVQYAKIQAQVQKEELALQRATEQRKKAEANAAAAKERNAAAEKNLQTATERRIAAEQRGQNLSRQRTLELEKQQTTADKLAASEKNHEMQLERTAERTRELMQLEEQRANNRLTLEQTKNGGKARVQELKNEGAAARDAAGGYNALQVALGNIASRAFNFVLRKVTQGIREALTEMKNVDTELTNISKVSGKTGDELAKIGNVAYDTASKYGVAASEYLSAVYDMQKAGMGDQSEAMGELAVKTMLVGDTTKDVASKFLLSANAAWKLEGNMESLSKIVDEADYINNNYATNLDKLASGMPIVASVAAQAGMSAEETMAALGTITHVTQESGTKAATALRALILNISGQVGKFVTEEGEEFEVTEKSVKSLQGLLEKYAKTEMDAAKAAGKLIDPMTAIRALFKGMSESDLNDVELFNLLSGMGGKLRTNQLTALVQNYGLFDEMLGKIADSAGTADSEIDLMMQSWERKTQVLKNTWTELIADVIDSDTIKGGIDALTVFVDAVDDIIVKSKDAANKVYDIRSAIDSTKEEISKLELKDAAEGLTAVEERRLAVLRAQLAVMEEQERKQSEKSIREIEDKYGFNQTLPTGETGNEAYLSGLRNGAVSARTDWNATADAEAYTKALQGIVDKYAEVYNAYKEIQDLGGELNQTQLDFMSDYEAVAQASLATAEQVNKVNEDTVELTSDNESIAAFWRLDDNVIDQIEHAAEIEQEAQDAREAAAAARQEELNNQNENTREWADFQQEMAQSMQDYDATIADVTSSETDASDAASEIASNVGDIDFSEANSGAATLLGLLKQVASIQFNPFGGMAFGFATGTTNAPGGPTLVNELGPELISENGRAYIANGGRPGIVNLSRGAIVLPAGTTREALKGNSSPKYIHAAASGWLQGLISSAGLAQTTYTPEDLAEYRTSRSSKPTNTGAKLVITSTKGKSGKGSGSGSGGGGGGSTAKSVEELAKETKDILSNIEKQAKLADNRKQYDKEAELWEKGQQEIDKMVAQYKKAGYKETDDEILDLLNKRYDYEKKREAANKKTIEAAASELKDKLSNLDKQAKLADTNGDYEKEVRFYEEAQEAIKEMVDKYRAAGYSDESDEIVDLLQKNVDYGEKQVKVYKDRWNDLIDALEADTDAQEAANALAEKEQALAEAREALANATKNRTVRTYNAATGQWEWVADQAKVKSAQETLTKAEENYAKEVKDQAISELERLRDTMADLNDVILGPALSAIVSQAESSDAFQNFARALNGVYGVGSYLASTEGSSKVMSSSSDSHDTFYTFGNVTLTEDEASSMSVAQLAQRLQVLKIS